MLMVLTVHVRGYLTNTPRQIYSLLGVGAYGVALYFMISGYLMHGAVDRYSNYGQYVVSRFTRILPMYYLSLGLTFACEQFVNWNFFCLLYDFLFGALAWFAIKENKKGRGLLYGDLIFMAGWLVGNRSGFFVFGAFFYCVILGLNFLKIDWKYDKVNTWIVTLSNVTYSVYLFHYFILQIFGDWFRTVPWYEVYMTFIVASFALGYILWKFVENPIGKYIINCMHKEAQPFSIC